MITTALASVLSIPSYKRGKSAAYIAEANEKLKKGPSFDDDQLFEQGAVGSCGCGQCPSTPQPRIPVSLRTPYVPGEVPKYAADVDSTGCGLYLLTSPLTAVVAGTPVMVPIQPSRGCFRGRRFKIFAVDQANPQTRQRVQVGRIFIGDDCPQDCRNNAAISDFFESDDCMGCPLGDPCNGLVFGRDTDEEELNVEITNMNAAGTILVQIGIWGDCLPGFSCIGDACKTC